MKIGEIIKINSPDTYKKLRKTEKITTKDCENMMKHSSYTRHRGAIRQVR